MRYCPGRFLGGPTLLGVVSPIDIFKKIDPEKLAGKRAGTP
jgi:hypothetical protein